MVQQISSFTNTSRKVIPGLRGVTLFFVKKQNENKPQKAKVTEKSLPQIVLASRPNEGQCLDNSIKSFNYA